MSSMLQQLNEQMSDVGDRVLRSLVHVRSGRRGAGAGTILRADGIIVTNAHVIQGRRRRRNPVQVMLPDGRELPARIIARDTDHDLAALRVDAVGLPAIELSAAGDVQPGQVVLAFGHPWGVAGAATSGIVIGMGNDLPEIGGSTQEWLAASLHLRPGHSGGPMVDMAGHLVGINTLMNGPDVGVAVPIHVVREFLRGVEDEQTGAQTVML